MAIAPGQLWIDNSWQPAASGESFDTPDPATGGVLTTLARARAADVDRAVAGARRAQPAWAALDPNEKQRILWRIGELILQALPDLAALEASDAGKPVTNARTIDVPRTADTFFYFAGWATKLHGETIPLRGPFLTYTVREPLGVVGAITPWNFPLLLAARKIAPALAAGNAVVIKPPEEASLSTLALGPIFAAAGLPAGLVQILTGLGPEAGAALVDHPDVAKISFTGGTDTGRLIMANASRTLKKLSLELGGKSPNIIFADADVEKAATLAVSAAFYNQGELCTCGSRLLVERSIHDKVVEIVVRGAERMKALPPLDPACAIGPLISAEHHARVAGYIQRGLDEGATLVTGGLGEGPGYYVRPTVFTGVRPEMAIAAEEIFGPVLSVIPFDTLDEAAAIADATEFGLAAGVWTQDITKAHTLAARLKAGTVWINTYNRFDAAAPYGGMKQSGFGRENGAKVLDEYTQTKTIWVNLG
jgi:aldehyde dehydrogenase (NAD+)/phenylacetaldehyde dehydrogenase